MVILLKIQNNLLTLLQNSFRRNASEFNYMTPYNKHVLHFYSRQKYDSFLNIFFFNFHFKSVTHTIYTFSYTIFHEPFFNQKSKAHCICSILPSSVAEETMKGPRVVAIAHKKPDAE